MSPTNHRAEPPPPVVDVHGGGGGVQRPLHKIARNADAAAISLSAGVDQQVPGLLRIDIRPHRREYLQGLVVDVVQLLLTQDGDLGANSIYVGHHEVLGWILRDSTP
ncbi:MAG: hypothetical protein IFK92_08305 [Acidobacteria bacterium]|nr:hypothetical protein [Candidatus Sulfomarinibacter kjeldsenii]